MIKCPVCNRNTESQDTSCPLCKTQLALVTGFTSKPARDSWKKLMEKESKNRVSSLVKHFSSHQLNLDSDRLSLRGDGESSVTVLKGNGETARYDNVLQYSKGSRHTVMLMADGTVKAEGFNGDGQCAVSDLKNVKYVYAGANATYAVTDSGSVIVRGISPVADQVNSWTNVSSLVGNRGRIAALTTSGRVLIADDTQSVTTDASGAVSVASTYNFTLWLNKDGTVGFSGKEKDPRATGLSKWQNVVSIAVDNYYAVGLTSNGEVLMSGKSVDFFDLGHSDAKSWKNAVGIACCNSGIMAVFSDGTVKIVGNVENKTAISQDAEKEFAKYI